MKMSRALILNGSAVFRASGPRGAHAVRLSQMLRGAPGTRIRLTVYILGETGDQPTPPNLKLEDDHFVASVSLGDFVAIRRYVDMVTKFDVPGNTRAWNRIEIENVFPASGQLELAIILQQNWPGRTDFFVDNLSVTVAP
ncbi:MAG: hypothetical protein HY784_11580 [Chloroflexi bacterium]|nr:hypothetical protein [Chloroflexota bacterium]